MMPHVGEDLIGSMQQEAHSLTAPDGLPHQLDEDLVGSMLQEADIANLYSEFEAELEA